VRLSEHEWATAKQVCTPRQVQALDLWRRGAGKKRIGLILGIDETTARQHVQRGLARLGRALEQPAA
jgi:DNA-binding CsgD family transcriptional regulator